jgi:hypothetical protein
LNRISPENPDNNAITDTADKRNALLTELSNLLDSSEEKERETGFFVVCDLVLVFSTKLRNTVLNDLAYEISKPLEQKLVAYFEQQFAAGSFSSRACFFVVDC